MEKRRNLRPKRKTSHESQQDTHAKRQQNLEYADKHKEVYGIHPLGDDPGTTSELARKAAEVERKRLHAEGKGHEYARKRDKYDTAHAKRQHTLESDGMHKGIYGVTPGTRYGVIGFISALCGVGFSLLL